MTYETLKGHVNKTKRFLSNLKVTSLMPTELIKFHRTWNNKVHLSLIKKLWKGRTDWHCLWNKPVCLGLSFKVTGCSDLLFIPLSSSDRRMMEHANPGAPSLSCEEFSWGFITRPLFCNICKNYLYSLSLFLHLCLSLINLSIMAHSPIIPKTLLPLSLSMASMYCI